MAAPPGGVLAFAIAARRRPIENGLNPAADPARRFGLFGPYRFDGLHDQPDIDGLHRLLLPAPVDELDAWPVTTLVNKPENNGPELVEPAPVVSAT